MALFVLSLCPFDISVGVGAFVIGLSQISSFCSIDIQVSRLKVKDHFGIQYFVQRITQECIAPEASNVVGR